MSQEYWRKCIVCKKEIKFSTKYFKCSIVSCDKKRSPAQFCSVECWDVHRSIMSHKSAGADEYQSPSQDKFEEQQRNEPKVRVVKSQVVGKKENTDINSEDILVVVSKLKAYIKDSSNFNTSADVMPVLSEIIRRVCDQAVLNAEKDERKTLMARDFK